LADDPELATNPQRVRRIDECDGAIAEWVGRHTQADVLARFLEFQVVAGPICDVAQIFQDPHVNARGTLVEMKDPTLGSVRVQGVVPRFSRNSAEHRWLGKTTIGADTADLLERAGYSPDEVAALEASGTIHLGKQPAHA
jgi:crotonobetainyl-CoA:carnitine CoA-transferase CaiB-like acyl-CoA transferase